MTTIQSHRAHVLNLCYAVEEACSLTDIHALKTQAKLIVEEMGDTSPVVKEEWEDLV